jgi:hypothetical protein
MRAFYLKGMDNKKRDTQNYKEVSSKSMFKPTSISSLLEIPGSNRQL